MRTRTMLCPFVPNCAHPTGGTQAKSGGALFKKFSGASRRKRCAPLLLKPFRRLWSLGYRMVKKLPKSSAA